MKTSQSLFSTVVKAIFVLFCALPLVGHAAFGDSLMQSEISWLEIDLMLGVVFFVSYLLIGKVSKSKTRLPMKKIYA